MKDDEKLTKLVDMFASRFDELEYFSFQDNNEQENEIIVKLLEELGYERSDQPNQYGYYKSK